MEQLPREELNCTSLTSNTVNFVRINIGENPSHIYLTESQVLLFFSSHISTINQYLFRRNKKNTANAKSTTRFEKYR